jgi:hypothetical protein
MEVKPDEANSDDDDPSHVSLRVKLELNFQNMKLEKQQEDDH